MATPAFCVPASGARFHAVFEGSVRGDRLAGTLSGTDHLYLRAHGRVELHIHGTVVTGDGASVAFPGTGAALV